MKLRSGLISSIASLTIFAIAIIVIVTYIIDKSVFARGLPGIYNLKINTAVCFLLSSFSLFIFNSKSPSKSFLFSAYISSLLVISFALLNLSQYLFNYDLGIDNFLAGPLYSPTGQVSMRTYFSTSLFFVFFNLIILVLRRPGFKDFIVSSSLLFCIILSTYFILYFAKLHFSNFGMFFKSALNTSLMFIVLFFGVFSSRHLASLKMSFFRRISAYFLFIFLVLCVVFVSIKETNSDTISIATKIDHHNELVLKSLSVFKLTRELVGESRVYVISGEQKYLNQYNNKIKVIQKRLNDLENFTASDTELNSLVHSLEKVVLNNINIRNKINSSIEEKGFNKDVVTGEVMPSQLALRDLNNVVNKIETIQARRLADLKYKFNQSVRESSKVTFLFQMLIILLLIIAFATIYNNAVKIKEAKDKITSQNIFLESILENIPNMLFVKKAEDLRMTIFNKAGENILGISRTDLIGKNDYDLFPPEQASYFISSDKKVLAQNGAVDFPEEVIQTKEGTKWLHTRKVPVKDDSGKTAYILGISEDITQKKIAGDKLKKASEEIFDLYNNAPCGYHSIDANFLFVAINDTELKWLGYNREEILGKSIESVLTPESAKIFAGNFENFKLEGIALNMELEMIRKDGSILPVLLSASAIYNKHGEFLRTRSTVLDFTELKKLNDEILKFNSELETKVKEKTADLKRSNEELERFAYVASHDLQEPLRMVSSFLNLLEKRLEGKLDDTDKKYIQFATDGALRMKELIQNLLEYSRVGNDNLNINKVDINLLVQKVLSLYNNESHNDAIMAEIEKLPVIKGNPSQLYQLFQNLIGNAVKYKNGSVLKLNIGCIEKNDHFEFFVKDNGVGIDSKYFEQIFIIFKRLHNRADYEGTGVGLSICKKIVQAHGGNIWVESESGKGSTFFFTIAKNI